MPPNKLSTYKYLIIIVLILNGCKEKNPQTTDTPPPGPSTVSYSIIKTYPHDTTSFTQGLAIHQGKLYEGTGNYGHSELLRVDIPSGKSQQKIKLGDNYFGEGITILHDTVYQLTWKEKKVFAYRLSTFQKLKEYDVEFEGWGLTNDGTHLIVSNGSGELFFFHPSDFKLVRTQQVTEAGAPSYNLNELEFINGYVYANQWQQPYILKIDPNTGSIVSKVDLTEMWNRVRELYPNSDVPNGIAFDPQTNKLYVTGKWWPELYEIQLSN